MKMIGGADCKKVRAVVLKQLFEIIDVCSKLSIREVAVKNPYAVAYVVCGHKVVACSLDSLNVAWRYVSGHSNYSKSVITFHSINKLR